LACTTNEEIGFLKNLLVSRYSNIETSLAMSTLASWSHVVQSRDVRSRIFSRPSNETENSCAFGRSLTTK